MIGQLFSRAGSLVVPTERHLVRTDPQEQAAGLRLTAGLFDPVTPARLPVMLSGQPVADESTVAEIAAPGRVEIPATARSIPPGQADFGGSARLRAVEIAPADGTAGHRVRLFREALAPVHRLHPPGQ